MNFLFNKTLLEKYRDDSSSTGLKGASFSLLHKLKTEVTSNQEIKNNKPTLIISNHASILDLLIIRLNCLNEDIFIITASVWSEILDALKIQILPVYLSNKPADNFLDQLRNTVYTFWEHDISRKDATALNKQTITQATGIINNGGTVVMFPGGGKLKQESNWESGTGYLINQLSDEAQIIFVSIKNTFRWDILKLTYLNIFSTYRPVSIIVSEPINVNDLKNRRLTGKELTKHVQKMYRTYFKN